MRSTRKIRWPDKSHKWQTRVQTQVLFISKCLLLKGTLHCIYRRVRNLAGEWYSHIGFEGHFDDYVEEEKDGEGERNGDR